MTSSRSFLCRSESKRASLLILVAWALSLLAIFAVSLGGTARSQLSFSKRLVQDATLRLAAEAGMARARAWLAQPQDAAAEEEKGSLKLWMERGEIFGDSSVGPAVFSLGYDFVDAVSGEPRFFYGLADEEGKVNLNTAAPDVLARLFKGALDIGSPQAQQLADAVVDWRDADSASQDKGAEDDFYEGLPVPYACKDAPFDAPDELLLVRGFDATIYKKIKGYVTVFGSGRLNINTVSAKVLEALGLGPKLVDKIVLYRRGPDARWGTADDGIFASVTRIVPDIEAFASLSEQEKASLESFVSANAFGVSSSYYSATCTARATGKTGTFSVAAVFERTLAEKGYRVQPRYWRTSL